MSRTNQIFTIYIRKKRFEEARTLFLKEIEKAFTKGEREVEVIHGIGEHILRKMVLNECSKIDYVRVQESHFHSNPGVLKLELLIPDPSLLKKYLA